MTESPSLTAGTQTRTQAVIEVGLIVLVMFVLSGGPTPAVNEAHYLGKARHYWDPTWCPTDRFLDSADAHLPFYLTFGWVTQFASFETTAWIGRALSWLLLAFAWQRLSWRLTPINFASVLSAGIWLTFVHHGHMSGEWILGGVEAKVFAYPLVLGGLLAMLKGQWRGCWIWFGAAAALHVLVGGWAVLTAFFSWSLQPRDKRLSLPTMIPGLIMGGIIALGGLIPAIELTRGVDPEIRTIATHIYVNERLPHHLLLRVFAPLFILRHLGLIVLFFVLSWPLRKDERFRPLWSFVVGSIGLAAIGASIDLLAGGTTWGTGLLRYYWFRQTDVFVPLGVSIFGIARLAELRVQRPQLTQALVIGLFVVLFASIGEATSRLGGRSIPAADRQGGIRTMSQWNHWRDVAEWCAINLPTDALVITPADHQTFRWYSDRSELVNWKDIPQDAEAIIDWRERRAAVDQITRLLFQGYRQQANLAMKELAEQYNGQYVVVRAPTSLPINGFIPIYHNPEYLVLRVEPADE